MSNWQEYLAGTNPTNTADVLEIIAYSTAPGGTTNLVTWTSVPTRFYYLQKTLSLDVPAWLGQRAGFGRAGWRHDNARRGGHKRAEEVLSRSGGASARTLNSAWPLSMKLLSGNGRKGWSVETGNLGPFPADRAFRAPAGCQRRRRRTQAGYGHPESHP